LELSYPPDQISLAPPIPNIKSSDVTINIEKESGVQAPYRYMWDTNPARASTQANRIEKISKTILALSQLPVEEDPAPFNVPNQASIVAIGQVVGEGEGLNEKTLTLQRNNVRAKIDVTDMKNYSLFSGQVQTSSVGFVEILFDPVFPLHILPGGCHSGSERIWVSYCC
jgi:hypothetical protein